MNILSKAYKKLFDKDPDNMEKWQVAKSVMEKFNVQKLGEGLAGEVLTEIISNTFFPDNETTMEVVGHAENLLTEFTNEFGEEPHFAAVEAGENQKKYRK